ncbi:HAD family phosphatase [Streptomyces sp. PTM05]|uniref:HAD family phosphatase n=1 Tax=Streptantibioticus parmotrematis TaxID=2873249 RepID=A0ABS7QU91_9ACTN|nr:HAD family phosphatase [Streptantibioticus parmotrematis]MBY8886760.1 HAD family phosphatase [Streptantibioticus parmotrematis]
MGRLHLFDMDGTLLHGSSANVELARKLGLVEEFRGLDAAFAAGRIDSPHYARRAYELWQNLTAELVAEAFAASPWLAGIREVWADIRARGEYCVVISLSPEFFVRHLLPWGAHATFGGRFPELPFRGVPLDESGILHPESKVRIADRLCADYGVTRADCVAYGDSMSDAALFRVVATSVAVNGDYNVSDIATLSYAGRDLRDAYELVLGA